MDDLNKFDISHINTDISDETSEFFSEDFIGGTEVILDILEEGEYHEEDTFPDIDDIQDDEEEIDVEENVSKSEIENWSISLSDVPIALKLSEYEQTYVYGRLTDPDGNPSNKFSGFYKNKSSKDSRWQSLPGVLSDKYIVVSLEKFVTNVIKKQFTNVSDESLHCNEAWRSVWLGTIGGSAHTIKYLDSETGVLISRHIAGEDTTSINLRSRLGYVITNTYNGTNKLKSSPIIKTIGNISRGSFTFNDFFTFCNFTQEISHNMKEENFTDNLSVIKENVEEHISILKNYIETDFIYDEILKCFKKSGRDEFFKIVHEDSGVNIEDNVFTMLICASIALCKNYSIIEHIAIRSKVMAFLNQILE